MGRCAPFPGLVRSLRIRHFTITVTDL